MTTSKSKVYVADTYALIELLIKNKNYEPFLTQKLVTTDFALVELYYYCLRYYGETEATVELTRHIPLRTAVSPQTLVNVAKFRFEHKQENLSYTDCVGWSLAQQLGVPFLTGDKAFADKPGVAFVR